MMLLAWVRLMVSLHRMSEVYGVSAQHEWGVWRLCAAWVRLMASLCSLSEAYGISAQHEWGLWRLCTVWVRFMASLRSKSEAYGVSAQHGRKMFLRKVSNAYLRIISFLMHFLHSEGRLIWVSTWVRLTAALRSVSKAYGVLHTLFTGGGGGDNPPDCSCVP